MRNMQIEVDHDGNTDSVAPPQEDEKQALSILRNAEARTGDFTIFDTPEQIYTIARNNRGY